MDRGVLRARPGGCSCATTRTICGPPTTPAGPGQDTSRLVTSLLDERAFPAEQLAAIYHERWEIETTLDEVKVHQWAHPRPLRSALRVLRRAIPRAQRTWPEAFRLFCHHLLKELDAERLLPRRPRQNPRAVKRKMSNFPRTRSPTTPSWHI